MLSPKKIEEIAKQVANSMPAGVRQFADDTERQVKQVLQSQLAKLDLITREEFDVQRQVLLRTREKLEALEQRLNDLEKPSVPATTDATEQPAKDDDASE